MTTTTSYSRPLAARRPGTCPACREAIEVGDEITRGENVRGYVHVGCRDARPPEREERSEVRVTEPGVYERDGVVYVVKRSQPDFKGQPESERRLYAKRIVEIGGTRATDAGTFLRAEFEYVRGAVYDLRPEDQMDLARAKELTLRYGFCIRCGRDLKAGESVEQGIGPVCVKKFPALVEERKAIAKRVRADAKARTAGILPLDADEDGESAYLAHEAEREVLEFAADALSTPIVR